MQTLTYIPAALPRHLTPALLAERGLAHLGDPKALTARECARGPLAGPGGLIVARGALTPETIGRVGYYPDRQKWRRVPHSSACVGYDTEHPPTPADLARAEQLPGHWITLGDGHKWLCPVARAWDDIGDGQRGFRCALPQRSTLDDAGNWQPGEVVEQHRKLWEMAGQWWDVKAGAAAKDASIIQFAPGHDAAVKALAANYHVSAAECALLGLLTVPVVVSILDALIDWPTLAEWQKKTASDSTGAASNTDAGDAESPA